MCSNSRLFLIAALALWLFATTAEAGENPGDGLEFAEETDALVIATAAFFDAVEATVPRLKNRKLTGTPRSAVTPLGRPSGKTGILTRKGPVDHLTGYRVTWYPLDHLSGTVDFMGTWNGNRNLVCGYLTWDMSDPSAPVLDRVSANFLDLSALKGVASSKVHASLLEANCAFGAIDANFHHFDFPG